MVFPFNKLGFWLRISLNGQNQVLVMKNQEESHHFGGPISKKRHAHLQFQGILLDVLLKRPKGTQTIPNKKLPDWHPLFSLVLLAPIGACSKIGGIRSASSMSGVMLFLSIHSGVFSCTATVRPQSWHCNRDPWLGLLMF